MFGNLFFVVFCHSIEFFPSIVSLKVVSGFEVTRRILVDLEGIGLKRKWLAGLEPEKVHMMIGRLIPQLPPCEK